MGEEKNQKKGLVIRAWASIKKIVCENKKTVIALAICLLVILGAAFVYWRPHYLDEGEKVLVNGGELEGYNYWQRHGFDQIKIIYEKEGVGRYCVIVYKDAFGGELKP